MLLWQTQHLWNDCVSRILFLVSEEVHVSQLAAYLGNGHRLPDDFVLDLPTAPTYSYPTLMPQCHEQIHLDLRRQNNPFKHQSNELILLTACNSLLPKVMHIQCHSRPAYALLLQ